MDDCPSTVDPSGPLPEVNNITGSVDVDPSDVDPSSPLLECTRCHVLKPVSTQPCASCNYPVLLKIPCLNASFGCTAVLEYSQLSTHSEKCLYTHSPCPFTFCGFNGSYRELYSHASDVHSDEVQLIECGVPLVIRFGHRHRVVLKESSHDGELLLLQRGEPSPDQNVESYFLSCISPKVPRMGNFCYKLKVTLEDAEGRSGWSAHGVSLLLFFVFLQPRY